jgi:hypothetical protein
VARGRGPQPAVDEALGDSPTHVSTVRPKGSLGSVWPGQRPKRSFGVVVAPLAGLPRSGGWQPG